MKLKTIALGLLVAAAAAGTAGWFTLDKETRALLATLPTNRDLLFWSQPQRDAGFRALDRLPLLAKSRAVLTGGLPIGLALDDPFGGMDQPILWSRPQRNSLKGTGLRDQSVMNKVQDEIFRLPMSLQVMLEGPPGTGKTSTLIKRLAQKLALTQESYEDYRLVAENSLGTDQRDSWIMFSPTELLEHYLREAFNRDNVPASQKRIQTWAGFRNDLAIRVLGLLRSGGRKTGFQREEHAQFLSSGALDDQPGLHGAFDQFQRDLYRADLDAALVVLAARPIAGRISQSGRGG